MKKIILATALLAMTHGLSAQKLSIKLMDMNDNSKAISSWTSGNLRLHATEGTTEIDAGKLTHKKGGKRLIDDLRAAKGTNFQKTEHWQRCIANLESYTEEAPAPRMVIEQAKEEGLVGAYVAENKFSIAKPTGTDTPVNKLQDKLSEMLNGKSIISGTPAIWEVLSILGDAAAAQEYDARKVCEEGKEIILQAGIEIDESGHLKIKP